MLSGGLTDEELARGKGQLRGSIVLGLEDPSSRMIRLGKSELVYPRLSRSTRSWPPSRRSPRTTCARSPSVVLGQPKALAVVGPFDDADAFASVVAN